MTSPREAYAGWERRSAARVLDAARHRALSRSRQLVRAASEIIKAGGLEALTVQAVLQRTGLSLRAFYQRFAGKDDLLLAVFEDSMRGGAELFRDQIAQVGDPLERLQRIVSGMLLLSQADELVKLTATLSREHFRLAQSRPDELRYVLEPIDTLLAEQLTAAMETGQVRRADPRRLARLIHNLVSATIHGMLLGSDPQSDPERAAAELWDFCLRAIEAR